MKPEEKKRKISDEEKKKISRRKKKREEDIKNSKMKNKETTLIMEFFVLLFLILSVYLIYFKIFEADLVVDNTYNKRIDELSNSMVRGKILSKNGAVLAQTNIEDGEEVREYPYDNMFCHVVGINSNGKSGLESKCNYALLSNQDTLFDELSNDLTGKKPIGNNVVTTLDENVQEAAYNAMSYKYGAVIAMEADTGNILAMVSKPDFNPNYAIEKYTEWAEYESNESVLLNRATQGLYPPGSTFKILTTLEYIRENNYDVNSFNYECSGGIQIPQGEFLSCFDGRVHGSQNLMSSFANSCNGAFATIGSSLDISKFKRTCKSMLFNSNFNSDIEHAQSNFALTENSSMVEVMETSIGQGKTQITPLHNLVIAATIANGGTAVKPKLIGSIETSTGKKVRTASVERIGELMTENEASILEANMRSVITDGVASDLTWAPYTVYGKTGSAQFDSSENHHSWFVGFADIDGKRIAISVIVEGGRDSFINATSVARQVFDACYNN